jgi:Holliday junction DNA helicase RuvA
MIGYLTGEIIGKHKQSVTILCGPVGYEVHVSTPLLETLQLNQKTALHIFTRVREDEITLYGFEKAADLDFFKLLISVNGVGPKTGLEIMSADSNQIKNAIQQENLVILSHIPGIGKKTAERIIIELRGKVQPENYQEIPASLEQKFDDVLAALMSLGYQRGEIYRVLKEAPAEISSTEEMVKFFLKNV